MKLSTPLALALIVFLVSPAVSKAQETYFTAPLYDETNISFQLDSTSATSGLAFYLTAPDGGTPEGLSIGSNGDFDTFGIDTVSGGGGDHDSGVLFNVGDTYEISLDSDFPAGTFENFVTDETTGGSTIGLGTYDSYDGPVSPSYFYSDTDGVVVAGGVSYYGSGYTATNLTISAAPEPTTAGLMLAGLLGLVMLVRRQKFLGV
jgi:hypothetical protein